MEEKKRITKWIHGKLSNEQIEQTLLTLNQANILDIKFNFTQPQQVFLFDKLNSLGINWKNIDQLNISIYKLLRSANELKSWIQIFDFFQSLEHLRLTIKSFTTIPNETFLNLTEILEKYKQLKTLKIKISMENKISEEGFIALSSSLKELVGLQELSLEIQTGNLLKENGASALGQSIQSLKSLKKVKLQIGEKILIGNTGAISLVKSLKELPDLNKMKFSLIGQNKCDEEFYHGLKTEFLQFQSIKTLEHLKLIIGNWNSLSSQGATHLAQGLQGAENLKTLELYFGQNNNIQAEGFKEIGCSFRHLKKLEEFTISVQDYNYMGSEGAKLFSQELIHLKTSLTKFSINIDSANFIKDGCDYLSQGISELVNLTKLFIRINNNNEIPKQGLQSFSRCLVNKKQLKELALFFSQNELDSKFVCEFAEQISQLSELESLSIDCQMKPWQQQDIQIICNQLILLQNLRYLGVRIAVDNQNEFDLGYFILQNLKLPNLRELYLSVGNLGYLFTISSQKYQNYAMRKLKRLIHSGLFKAKQIEQHFKQY